MIEGIFDISLFTTAAFVLGATLLNKTIGLKRRDVCLKAFEGFNVTIELDNGKKVWGDMELEYTGLELRYKNSVKDDNHVESGYILYENEFGNIRTIQRLVDNLSEENRQKRDQDLKRSFYPNFFRKFSRAIQRFIAVTSNSLSELLSLLIGRMRKPAGRFITDHSQSHIQSLGTAVIGHVGYAHDPLLEKFIGQRVVIEVLEKGNGGEEMIHEHVGVFKNYSPDFLEVLQIEVPKVESLTIRNGENFLSGNISANLQDNHLRFENLGRRPILLNALDEGEDEQLLNLLVEPNSDMTISVENLKDSFRLFLQSVNEMDLIIPRTRCVVRHRVDGFVPSQVNDMIFDIGVLLKRGSLAREREQRLRKVLKKNPDSVIAAANLGAMLLQQTKFEESRDWLTKAEKSKHLLPDSGRRVDMLLRELSRKTVSKTNEVPNRIELKSHFSEFLNLFEFVR